MSPPPLANEALCLSTPKHNGKSGTVCQFDLQLPMQSVPRYNWNIIESGVKHHQTNKQT
jgi:hypothetical protein